MIEEIKKCALVATILGIMSFAACKSIEAEDGQGVWRVELCASNYGSHDPWLLVKLGIATTNQVDVAKMLSLLDGGGPSCDGCFCGPETYQVFESNGIPVMVVSAEMNGRVLVDYPKIVRNQLGYFVYDDDTRPSKTPFCCEEYYRCCHALFMNGLEQAPSLIVGLEARSAIWSISNALKAKLGEVGRDD